MESDYVKHFLQAVLFGCFLWQGIISIQKLYRGDTLTMKATIYQEEIALPSLTICFYEVISKPINESKSLIENYEDFLNNIDDHYVYFLTNEHFFPNGTKKSTQNYTNEAKFSSDNTWISHVELGYYGEFAKCEVYNPPRPWIHSSLNYILFLIPHKNGKIATIKLHERDQMVLGRDWHLGNTVFRQNPEENLDRILEYNIKFRQSIRLKTKENGCNEENNSKVYQCLQKYLDDKMNCTLPWRTTSNASGNTKGSLRSCDRIEDTINFVSIINMFNQPKFEDLKAATGCTRNCQTRVYDWTYYYKLSITIQRLFPDMPTNLTGVYLTVFDPNLQIDKESLVYDLTSFVGDVGGLLGLLLGLSLLDIYSFLRKTIENTYTNCKNH